MCAAGQRIGEHDQKLALSPATTATSDERSVGRRVKTGCITCRIRRVKCDEQRPECQRCTTTRRVCEGYSTLSFSRRELQVANTARHAKESRRADDSGVSSLAHAIVTDPAFQDVVENRYFQFFRLKTVASTNSLMDSRFWDKVVLQLYHAEPAVKHAVLALSSTHQVREAAADIELALQHQEYADIQYSKALLKLRDLLYRVDDSNVERILIAIAVLTCFENVQGRYYAGQIHAEAGRKILVQQRHWAEQRKRRIEVQEIQQLFRRLDVSLESFSDSAATYPYGDEAVYAAYPDMSNAHFNNLDDARSSLVDLIRGCQFIGCQMVLSVTAATDGAQSGERQHLLDRLLEWHSRFEVIVAASNSTTSTLVLTLRVWYLLSSVAMKAGWTGSEMRWDAHTDIFDELVTYGELLFSELGKSSAAGAFSFDLGYIVPLFFTAERCRDPHIRRRALAVLKAESRQEGVWASRGAAEVAERWMLIEEYGLVVKLATDIPQYHRLEFVDVALEPELRRARILFKLSSCDVNDDERKPRDELIAMEGPWPRRASAQRDERRSSKVRLTSMSGDHYIEHRIVVANPVRDIKLETPEAIHALFD